MAAVWMQICPRWALTDVLLTLTMAIALLGVGSVTGGLWLYRVGPRVPAPNFLSDPPSGVNN